MKGGFTRQYDMHKVHPEENSLDRRVEYGGPHLISVGSRIEQITRLGLMWQKIPDTRAIEPTSRL